MFLLSYVVPIILTVFVIIVLSNSFRVIDQYERGIRLRLGKFVADESPGLLLLIPIIDRLFKVDMRVQTQLIAPQDVITKDNVSVKVAALAIYKVVDAQKALLAVDKFQGAIARLAQITLRATIGEHSLQDLLSEQSKLNGVLRKTLDERTHEWGVKVEHVEISNVDLDSSMVRAMAQAPEANRGAEARVISAEGELRAAKILAQAGEILATAPASLTLRALDTLKEIGAEQNSIIIFPVSQETLMGPPPMASAALASALARSGRHPDKLAGAVTTTRTSAADLEGQE
jgi:regulator of protease activity HflC (stomatin/prohibitin superfamily)